MSEKEMNDTFENEEQLADNLAEDVSKEPLLEEEETNEEASADNVSDELAKIKDAYVRLMAEYDNYRKRTMKEKADLIKNGGEKTLVGLLPIIDDFQRALENIDKSTDVEALKEGVDLIYNKFMSFLSQNGVKAIETVGEPFDADLSEAVAAIPAQSEDQKGKVIDNVQTGYMLHDKVIRHAKVVVAN